jgi:RNA polymerase sigma-70 factor, ECF subfamily
MSDNPQAASPAGEKQVELLFVQHAGAIRAFVRALQPSLSDSDDVMQETFLAVSQKAATFVMGTNFVAWAFAIARLKVLEHHRRQRRAAALSEAAIVALADDAPDPEMSRRRESALAACLERLTPKARNLLWRKYSSRQSSDEMGSQLGMTATAVRLALFKARALLRDCISAKIESAT